MISVYRITQKVPRSRLVEHESPESPASPDKEESEGVIEARRPDEVTEAPPTEPALVSSQLQSLPFQVVGPGLRTIPGAPTVPLVRTAQVPAPVPALGPVAVGQKTVPQSSQPVVTGYFSFPTAGFDFNF